MKIRGIDAFIIHNKYSSMFGFLKVTSFFTEKSVLNCFIYNKIIGLFAAIAGEYHDSPETRFQIDPGVAQKSRGIKKVRYFLTPVHKNFFEQWQPISYT